VQSVRPDARRDQPESDQFDWLQFIGRTLAYLSLSAAQLQEASLLAKADFLMSRGLPRREVALVLSSTDESLRVQLAKRAAKLKKAEGSKDA
jgi:hypothetical protein